MTRFDALVLAVVLASGTALCVALDLVADGSAVDIVWTWVSQR